MELNTNANIRVVALSFLQFRSPGPLIVLSVPNSPHFTHFPVVSFLLSTYENSFQNIG